MAIFSGDVQSQNGTVTPAGHVTEPATDCCTLYISNPSAEEALKSKAFFDIDYIKVFEPEGSDLPRYPAGTYRNGGVFVGDV